MDKNILINLVAIARSLDNLKEYKMADAITKVMHRLANQPWWENEAGEPMYSPEAIRAEETANTYDDYRYDDYPLEQEEPARMPPSDKLIAAVQHVLGMPPGRPFSKGYVWAPLDDQIAFEDKRDLMKVVEWLGNHPEFNNEWTGYNQTSLPPAINTPYESDIPEGTQEYHPREDFGWAGDERLLGE